LPTFAAAGIIGCVMAQPWEAITPDLIADVRLYSTEEGGKSEPVRSGYFPPCFPEKDTSVGGWDARMQLGDEAFEPGTTRRVGFVLISQDSAEEARRAVHFYLWDARFVGEATVVG
jgi:hypothetical protein